MDGGRASGEALGVGGRARTEGSGLDGVLSRPLRLSSQLLPFCCGGHLFFAILAPFLAFLKRTDVRRPTPTGGRAAGGVPSGVTS